MNDSSQNNRRVFLRSATAATLGGVSGVHCLSAKANLPERSPVSSRFTSTVSQDFETAQPLMPTLASLQLGPWRDLPPQPIGLAGHFSWWAGDRLLAAGGSYWEAGKKLFVSSVWSYRLGDEIWLNSGKLRRPVCYMVGVVFEDTPYIFGGSDATETFDETYQLLVDHDAKTAEWRALAPLPLPRECAGGGILGSRAMLVGGARRFDAVDSYANDFIWLDLKHPNASWKSGPPLPGPNRCLPTTAVCGDILYSFGGFRHEKPDVLRNLSDVYSYNARLDSWKRLSDLPFALRSASACSYGDKYILIVGGAGTLPEQPARFNTVLLYDIAADKYYELRPLPHRVSVPAATVKGSDLYVVGGEPPDGNRVSRVLRSAIA